MTLKQQLLYLWEGSRNARNSLWTAEQLLRRVKGNASHRAVVEALEMVEWMTSRLELLASEPIGSASASVTD
jgi:hypothetical protein